MTALLTTAVLLSFRSFSFSSVREESQMAAQIVKVALTEQMLKGVIEHREDFYARLLHIPGLSNIHVSRSQKVIDQFGPEKGPERPLSEEEKKVMTTGTPHEKTQEGDRVLFQHTIPYKASVAGAVNCMKCHHVSEGDILGTITLTMDLTERRNKAILSVILLLGLIITFGIALIFFLRRLLNPIVKTTVELKESVSKAEHGDFSGRLDGAGDDEIGDITQQTNRLMATLEKSIGTISKEIEGLSGQNTGHANGNQLEHTVDVVHSMVQAMQFKQMVENDRNLEDVFVRLRQVLKEHFALKRFSLYEVGAKKKKMNVVFVEGLPAENEIWCDADILVDSEICRAKRTAQGVSSIVEDNICPAFCGNRIQDNQHLLHVCIPLILGGSVGGVLQIIFSAKDRMKIIGKLSTIRTYLNEIAPVIETKRLMKSLHESSMRDAMTGMYNRRFLEEYVETLAASVSRRNTQVGVMMCDVDFFKQVNDTLGHETGDSVLKGVAEILKKEVRTSDLAIRYGGEEFLILLVDASEEKALEVAERIRNTLEEHSFPTSSGPLKKTLSIGISMYPADTDGFWECVKFADVALYKAKETGRNKVLRFKPDMWEATEGKY